MVVAACALAAVAGGAGWDSGHPQRKSSPPARVQAGPVHATLSSRWSPGRAEPGAKVGSARLTNAAALDYRPGGARSRSVQGQLLTGLVVARTPVPTPQDFAGPEHAPIPTRIGTHVGYRLATTTPAPGVRLSGFFVPTRAGYVVFRCRASSAQFTAFEARCRGAIAGAVMSGGLVESIQPSPSFAHLLAASFARLASARGKAGPGLLHHALADRKKAARATAGAYRDLASAWRRASTPIVVAEPMRELTAAADRVAGGFDQLATAAHEHDRSGYTKVVETIRARLVRLRRSTRALARSGYAIAVEGART
jgi:hypothetical protein